MAIIPQKQPVILKDSRRLKSSAGQVAPEIRNRENLWENHPEVTPAMKQAIQQFKDRFNSNEQWDGDFSL